MKKLLKLLSVLAVALSLSTGIAAAQTTVTNTGPSSDVTVTQAADNSTEVTNDNEVNATNNNDQTAISGSAEASGSTEAGGAVSGAARNNSDFKASVTVDNSSATSCACSSALAPATSQDITINKTGPNSFVTIDSSTTNETTVDNTNNLNVTNNNSQTAISGNALVTNNTEGGSARSGDAVNTSSSSFTFKVTN